MSTRVDAFLDVVRNPDGPALQGSDPADDCIRGLLINLIYADGELADEEISLGLRLYPGLAAQEALAEIRRHRNDGVDIQALLAAVPDPTERRKLLQYAMHIASSDSEIQEEEAEFIVQLRGSVQPPPGRGR